MSRISRFNSRLFAITSILLAVIAVSRFHSKAQIQFTNTVTVVSAATFEETPIAPESIAAAFGDGLAIGVQAATTTPLPLVLIDSAIPVGEIVLSSSGSNRPPVIIASSSVSADEGKRTDFNFTASDADPDQTLQASLAGPLFAMLINRGGGGYTLRVTPGFEDAGSYTVTITATDSLGATATHTIKLIVVNVNQPPTANSQSVTTDEDTAKEITLTGSDPDRNALRFITLAQPRRSPAHTS